MPEAPGWRCHLEAGTVTVRTAGFSQEGTVVISSTRRMMVSRSSELPELPIARALADDR